jgi:hypothetical protein
VIEAASVAEEAGGWTRYAPASLGGRVAAAVCRLAGQ